MNHLDDLIAADRRTDVRACLDPLWCSAVAVIALLVILLSL